jgi:hypothetical protein
VTGEKDISKLDGEGMRIALPDFLQEKSANPDTQRSR